MNEESGNLSHVLTVHRCRGYLLLSWFIRKPGISRVFKYGREGGVGRVELVADLDHGTRTRNVGIRKCGAIVG